MFNPTKRTTRLAPDILISGESGLSLVELLVTVAIMGILVMGAITYHTAAYKSTTLNQDRAFAIQKAIQLTNELRQKTVGTDITVSLKPYDQVTEDASGNVLSQYFSPVLSLLADLPNDPLSDNVPGSNGWKFQRQIDVRRFDYSQPTTTEEPLLVTARIFYTHASNPNQGGLPLAEITTVMRSLGQSIPTNQVFDLYVIAVENTPGWWVSLSTLRPILINAMNNLQATNPGLQYRVHWITRNAFGRDKSYTPFINTNSNISSGTYDDIESVYYYAGLLETTNASGNIPWWLYNPDFLTQAKINPGRVVGGVGVPNSNVFQNNPVTDPVDRQNILNAGLLYDPLDPPNTPTGAIDDDQYLTVRYTLADYYNHAVRYPEELTEYCMRKFGNLPGRNANNNLWECNPANPMILDEVYTEPSLEPSLRLLLEQLYQNPAAYQNILIFNAHGELLPVPPMRNYSDPAKNPAPAGTDPRPAVNGFPSVRVVAHPEQLEYQNGSHVRLRVYSYVTDPAAFTTRCDGTTTSIAGGNPQRAILDRDCDPTTANTGNKNDEVPLVIRISGINFNGYNLNAGLFVRRIVGNTPFNEDVNGDSILNTTNEDANNNDVLDAGEDANGNGRLDVSEDMNGNNALNSYGNQDVGYFSGRAPTVERTPGEMWYEARLWPNPVTGPDILILLYNSPLRHQLYTGANPGQNTGLPVPGVGAGNDRRLYGMEYIPASTGITMANNFNLTSVSTTNHKNTARWILTLRNPNGLLDNNQLTIETRIAPRRQTGTTTYPSDGIAVAPETSTQDDQYFTRALAQGYDPANPNSYIPAGGLYGSTGSYNFVTANNVPSNVSRTYVWISDISCAAAGGNPCINPANAGRAGQSGMEGLDFPFNPYRAPFTERFQFMGDPRHSPYWDVRLDDRYNWYFRAGSVLNTNGFTGFTANANDGWTGRVPFDYPRFSQVYRMGILKSRSIFNSIAGWSFYYVDPGSAMGGDNTWMPVDLAERNWIRVPETGFVNRSGPDGNDTYNTTFVNLDEIAGWHGGRTRTVRQMTGTAWFAKTWLGELYPDISNNGTTTINYYSDNTVGWRLRGNLPTRIGTNGLFQRDTEKQTYLGYNASRGTQGDSPPSFFNNAERFNHIFWNPTTQSTTRTCRGDEMAGVFNFSLSPQVATARPFRPNQNTGSQSEFNVVPYNTALMRTNAALFSPFYYEGNTTCNTTSFPNLLGSALIQVRLNPNSSAQPDADDLFGYFMMNGLAPANDSDPNLASNPNDFLAQFNILTMTYGFMQTGQPTHPVSGQTLVGDQGIRQLPRVEVVGPDPANQAALKNPSSLTVQWRISWRRWNNQPYTSAYAANFFEATDLFYVPMYSVDGVQWRYIIGDNDIVPDWRSRDPLPVQNSGKYDPNVHPVNKRHFMCRGGTQPFCTQPAINNALTTEQFTWNLSGLNPPLDLGAGNTPPGQDYFIRVVVHRQNINNHLAYHDLKIRVTP